MKLVCWQHPAISTDAASKDYVDDAGPNTTLGDARYLRTAGETIVRSIAMGTTNKTTGSAGLLWRKVTTKSYTDTAFAKAPG